jgi:protein-disulfide isomerase
MSKNRDLRQQQQARQQRQTLIMFSVIGAVAALLIGGAIFANNYFGLNQSPANALPAIQAPAAAGAASGPVAAGRTDEPANADHANRAWGPADAPIRIVEFVDYQCPACGNFNKNFEPAVVEAFAKTGKVRYEIRALTFLEQRAGTKESSDAAKATLCSAEQGKFWQMHNAIFANQFGENRGNFSRARLKEMAAKVGANADAFEACLASGKYDEPLKADTELGTKYQVTQTPSFVINDKLFAGSRNVADFKKIFAELRPDVKFD